MTDARPFYPDTGEQHFAIDPGGKACATAAGVEGALVWVGSLPSFVSPPKQKASGPVVAAYYEVPDRQEAPLADLVKIATAGAQLAAWLSRDVHPVGVQTWKGSMPKPIHHARMWEELSREERRVLGGPATGRAIDAAAERGAADRWRKSGKLYYRAGELPKLASGLKITHDTLDAAALLLWSVGRLPR